MRITKISVRELFGNPALKYDIELKTDPPITILHGRNGSGKTVIFKMIHGLFNSNYFIFQKYPFKKFRVEFDDGEHVLVTRAFDEEKKEYQAPKIIYSKYPKKVFPLEVNKLLKQLPRSLRNRLAHSDLPSIDEITSWANEVFEAEYNSPFRDRFLWERLGVDGVDIEEFEWLRELNLKLDVHFISTYRLLFRKRESDDRPITARRDSVSSTAAIAENSKDLSRRIQAVIFQANTQENTLNRTFPGRVVKSVNAENEETWQYQAVKSKLNNLKQERERLVEVGLLEPGEELQVDDYDDHTLGNVLKIYIEDTKEKLRVYDELAKRIEVFNDIVKEMLIDKTLQINKEGYKIKSQTGSEIPLEELSSGEQHMIVLMYNLLFRDSSQVDELILIDEPEISLHIAWQKQFISNLEKISKLTEFDVMIATHSPSIIGGRWELEESLQSQTTGGE